LFSKYMKNELTFIVEDAEEGGYIAQALGEGIVTEADTIDQLHEMVRDAVDCHFESAEKPKVIHLHFVRDEVIAA
jgi:predicted RNase H-like HicB family nuclease